jgi:hypothetical protein
MNSLIHQTISINKINQVETIEIQRNEEKLSKDLDSKGIMEENNDLTDYDFKSNEKKGEEKSNLIGDNPWNVQTWDKFCLYVCPECYFMDQDHNAFCDHALKTHEKVKIFSRFKYVTKILLTFQLFFFCLNYHY